MPLVVKWADTEKERQARRAQKAQSQSSNIAKIDSGQQSSLFGALPMGYIPPYNGFGYQVKLYLLSKCSLGNWFGHSNLSLQTFTSIGSHDVYI